jgi:hypothetical protein
MMFAFILVFVWTVWAALFWGSIRIVDSQSSHNYFAHALLWSAVQLAVSLAGTAFGIIGSLAMLALWWVFLMRLLLHQYEMGFLQALLVLAMLIAAPFLLEPVVLYLVEVSEVLALVVFFGAPFFILGGWLWGRRRARRAGEDARIPRAFAFRRKRAEPAPVVAAPVAPPVVAPPIIPAPAVVVPQVELRQVIVAPARAADTPVGEPTLLK